MWTVRIIFEHLMTLNSVNSTQYDKVFTKGSETLIDILIVNEWIKTKHEQVINLYNSIINVETADLFQGLTKEMDEIS